MSEKLQQSETYSD